MNPWQQRIQRAEELARRYPVSAELMYFYRDIVRVQATLGSQDVEPLRAFIRRDPFDPLAGFLARILRPCPPVAGAWSDTCPCCGGPLRTWTSTEFAHIRVEACDRCRTYGKAVDLTQDPAAVPEVDDLASVPLDLWAEQQGYSKPAPNLFGL